MKMLLLVLLPMCALAQNIKTIHPEIRQIDTDFEESFVARYDSPENKKKCEELAAKLEKERRFTTTEEENKILKYCPNMFEEDPWAKPFTGCSWYCGGEVDTVVASSGMAWQQVKDFHTFWHKTAIHDHNYGTPWMNDSAVSAVGQYIKYSFGYKSAQITEIVIVNGFAKTEDTWRKYSRVKKIRLWVNKKPFAVLYLKDNKEEQAFRVPRIGNFKKKKYKDLTPDDAWTITFEIIEVYPGELAQAALSEIYFEGWGHGEDE